MREQGVPHDHTEHDPECFRCQLSEDEVALGHTPGPWSVGEREEICWDAAGNVEAWGWEVQGGPPDNRFIVVVYQDSDDNPDIVGGDAHLIGAAPALLDALRDCAADLVELAAVFGAAGNDTTYEQAHLEAADRAIALASYSGSTS